MDRKDGIMKLKTIKIISTIGIFLLCFPLHFIYKWIPNGFTSIFTPVNESIWEHMKLIFTSTILWSLIDYILLKKNDIKYNNFFTQLFLSSFLSIPIYLTLFLPIYYKIGENMFVSISIMAIVIIITQILSYYILKSENIKILNYVSVGSIIIMYIIFGYLTYNAPHNQLFLDTKEEKYGINNYNV